MTLEPVTDLDPDIPVAPVPRGTPDDRPGEVIIFFAELDLITDEYDTEHH